MTRIAVDGLGAQMANEALVLTLLMSAMFEGTANGVRFLVLDPIDTSLLAQWIDVAVL